MGSSSEHWRTICVCNICGHTPELAPLFKCKIGHTFCSACHQNLRQKTPDGQHVCSFCGCKEFSVERKGPDFLRKLKIKPGIGRPYRYKINRPDSGIHSASSESDSVTVEKLFRLPKDELKQLFSDSVRLKSKNTTDELTLHKQNFSSPHTAHVGMLKSGGGAVTNTSCFTRASNKLCCSPSLYSVNSKKPLRCPHDPCRTTIAISSFLTHFKHEHPEIRRYNVDRGKQLSIPCDASVIEHNITFCLALITVYDVMQIKPNPKTCPSVANVCNKLNSRFPCNTFWLMVSGSPDERPSNAYALYWLFSNTDCNYSCTLEMMSANCTISCSSFCNTNGIHDSQDINKIAQGLNCLYLSRGYFVALLEEGTNINLNVVIH